MINQFPRYGKRNQLFLLYNEIKYRFKINPFTEQMFKRCPAKPYVTKLNKFALGIAVTITLLMLPIPGPLNWLIAIPLMRWGLR